MPMTPAAAPWIVTEMADVRVAATGQVLATVRRTSGIDELYATASLVAAAPDLLAALYAALPFVEDAGADPTYKPGYPARIEQMIRAAIAKAEGVEQ